MNVFRLDETKAAEQERDGGTDAHVARSNSPAPGSRKHIGNAGNDKSRGPIPRPQSEDRIGGGVAIPDRTMPADASDYFGSVLCSLTTDLRTLCLLNSSFFLWNACLRPLASRAALPPH